MIMAVFPLQMKVPLQLQSVITFHTSFVNAMRAVNFLVDRGCWQAEG